MGLVDVELIDGFVLNLNVAVIEMFDVETVPFVFFVIEIGEFVDGDFVITVEVFPPGLVASQGRGKIGVDHIAGFLRSDVEGAHGKDVDSVCRRGSSGGHDGFHYPREYVGTFARGNVDSHAGSAEEETSFVVAFADFGTDAKSNAVEHELCVFRVAIFGNPKVEDFPSLAGKVLTDGFFEGESREVGSDDDFFIGNGVLWHGMRSFHYVSFYYSMGEFAP